MRNHKLGSSLRAYVVSLNDLSDALCVNSSSRSQSLIARLEVDALLLLSLKRQSMI